MVMGDLRVERPKSFWFTTDKVEGPGTAGLTN
jgi:hypothetical protein